MVKLSGLWSKIGLFSLFFGIAANLFLDIVLILTNPLSIDNWKLLALDAVKTVSNSQKVISDSVIAFADTDDVNYRYYLLFRILGGTIITFTIIYFVYKGLAWFVPSHQNDFGAKIMLLIGSVLIVWLIGLLYSVTVENRITGFYQGFYDLITKGGPIRDFILQQRGVGNV